MRRGDIVIFAAKGDYTGKPRPGLVVQADLFAETASVTLCLISSALADAPLLRIDIEPTAENGLAAKSQVMIDKITTVRRDRILSRAGILDDAAMLRVERSLMVFLGIAKAPAHRPDAKRRMVRKNRRKGGH